MIPIVAVGKHKNIQKIGTILLIMVVVATLFATQKIRTVEAQQERKYDTDRDGLIEIQTLDQLHAIRYDLDGDGEPDEEKDKEAYQNAFVDAERGMGCPTAGCSGYELKRDLDFKSTNSYDDNLINQGWTEGEQVRGNAIGWEPIGACERNTNPQKPFTAILNGNGYSINNLYIRRTGGAPKSSGVGLFGCTDSKSDKRKSGIKNIALTNVVIDSRVGDGTAGTGALVGNAGSTIENSYATGTVTGRFNVGGLVGKNSSTLQKVYSTVKVSGSVDGAITGGLVGLNGGSITNSYAAGSVVGNRIVGGFVGKNEGTVRNSYATGGVFSNTEDKIGGFIGENSSNATVRGCFWNPDTSGRSKGAGHGKDSGITAANNHQLKNLNGRQGRVKNEIEVPQDLQGTGIWNFGTSQELPVLSARFKERGRNEPWTEFGYQVRETPELVVVINLEGVPTLTWTPVRTKVWTSAPSGSYSIYCNKTYNPIAKGVRGIRYTTKANTSETNCDAYQVVATINGGEASSSGWRTPIAPESAEAEGLFTSSGSLIHGGYRVRGYFFDSTNVPEVVVPRAEGEVGPDITVQRRAPDHLITTPQPNIPNTPRRAGATPTIDEAPIAGGLVPECGFGCRFTDLFRLAERVMQVLIWAGSIGVAGVIVWAGARLALNAFFAGPEEEKKNAIGKIKFAVIGLILILAAWVIVRSFFTLVGYEGDPFNYGVVEEPPIQNNE